MTDTPSPLQGETATDVQRQLRLIAQEYGAVCRCENDYYVCWSCKSFRAAYALGARGVSRTKRFWCSSRCERRWRSSGSTSIPVQWVVIGLAAAAPCQRMRSVTADSQKPSPRHRRRRAKDMSFTRVAVDNWLMYFRFFRPGRCQLCGRWTWMILRSESTHESCWLLSK